MTAPDLPAFLLARLGDDVERLQDVAGHSSYCEFSSCTCGEFQARVLADVEARRRIVAWLTERERVWVGGLGDDPEHPRPEHFVDGGPKASPQEVYVLRLLAQPYADHPDFDPSWRL